MRRLGEAERACLVGVRDLRFTPVGCGPFPEDWMRPAVEEAVRLVESDGRSWVEDVSVEPVDAEDAIGVVTMFVRHSTDLYWMFVVEARVGAHQDLDMYGDLRWYTDSITLRTTGASPLVDDEEEDENHRVPLTLYQTVYQHKGEKDNAE